MKPPLRILLLALFAAGCRPETRVAPAVPPPVVRVLEAVTVTTAVPVEAIASLRRKTEPVLSFKVGGPVAEVLVREGDAVQRGQALARLRTDEIDSEVARAESKLQQEQRTLSRLERLNAEQAAPLEEVQNARSAVEQAGAALRSARFNRELCVIVAPARGRILKRHAEPGELLAAGRPVVTFASEEDGWIATAAVSASEIGALAPGNRALLRVAEAPAITGTVRHIAEAADPATRTFDVEIQLAENPAGLRSGTIVTATIQPDADVRETALPLGALISGDGECALVCTVTASNTIARLPVRIRRLAGDQVRLAGPLPEGTRIVAVGAEFLRDGQGVRVLAPGAGVATAR